ncbi:hypothetical protein B9Z55_021458 [Caenorhabditis nigoni]|uniref:Uncharacterized protein n=1 Tax=Caenorhabditis nigoni TaxID=1611254 RepID=A0A2G5TS10_9PELO|nr:hypothetical protein B9Z55_021458 [Caenorhabditis nigoni]
MNNIVVVVKPPSGDAFNRLIAILVENQLDFSVKCSEPIKEAPTSSQASQNIDFPATNGTQEESNREIQKITSNGGEISDNLADNELKIPQSESIAQFKNTTATTEDYDSSENIDFPAAKRMKLDNLEPQNEIVEPEKPDDVAPIAQVTNEPAQIVSESNQTYNIADKVPNEEPEPESMESETSNNVPVAPIAHVNDEQSVDHNPGMPVLEVMGKRGRKKILICQVCRRKIVKRGGFHRRQHALHHLKLKTWKCTVCEKLLSPGGVGSSHFNSMHPEVPYTRLVETISEQDKKLVDEMEIKCFPSMPASQKRHLNDH